MSSTALAPGVRPVRPAASAPRSCGGELRLTRRGRVVVLLLAVVAVLAAGVLLASGAVGTAERGQPTPTETVVVGEGDTLWDIAADAAPDGDTGAMVEQISDLNALDSRMLVAGQRLRVPTD